MSTALAKPGVIDLIRESQSKVKARLPEGMDATKFLYGIATAIQKNPALENCNPDSVLLAAYEAAEVGCSLSPSLALGFLIPYGSTCQFQPSYRFFMQAAYQTGDVKSFFAEVRYKNDKFERQYAPKRNLFHAPGDGDRGEKIGAYAFIEFADGSTDWEYCDAELIERHRKHSKQPDSMMWTKFAEEGWRKTAIRILAKRIPLKSRGLEKFVEMVNKDAELEVDPPARGAVEVEAGAPAVVAPQMVSYSVGDEFTTINGNVTKVSGQLSRWGGRPEGKSWLIPANLTHLFIKLCEDQQIPLTEIQTEAPHAPAQAAKAEPESAANVAEAPKSEPRSEQPPPKPKGKPITSKQRTELLNAAAQVANPGEMVGYVKSIIKKYGFEKDTDVTDDKFDSIIAELRAGGYPE
jgi:recombination protein RecT